MEHQAKAKMNTQIYEEACSWFVDCRSGDLSDTGRRGFDCWLRKSPEHLSAYLEVAAIWNEGPALDPSHKWDIDTLIAESQKSPENVVSLSVTSAVGGLDESRLPLSHSATAPLARRLLSRRRFAFAAAVTAVSVIAGSWLWLKSSGSVYITAIGEQRSIELADGSTVSMNSRTRIRVRYSTTERAVDLLEGQALFHVAKDHDRPFIVSAHDTGVRAVGTQFDVYERHAGTTVTVLEGQVAVRPPSAETNVPPSDGGAAPASAQESLPAMPAVPVILVSAGEQLTVTPNSSQKPEHADVAAATAWTERRIVFESATLSEVAEEFNRYNERQLVIEDPDLLTFHVSGVFSSTDPQSLIRFLRTRPGVKVTEEESEIRISKII